MRKPRVDATARADVRRLLRTSARVFGAKARSHYKALLDRAIAMLCENPARIGAQRREGLPEGYFLFHLRHARKRGDYPKEARHFILFRYDDERLVILRVLHDSMDIDGHIGGEGEEP